MIIYQGGYLPYHSGPKSDHILVCIKIPHLVAFGNKNPPLRSPSARRLRLHNPRGMKNYISKLRLLIRQAKIPQRLRELENLQYSPPSQEEITEYRKIDLLLMKNIRLANDKVRRLNVSGVQSSRSVKLSQLCLRLSIIIIKRK